SQRFRLSGPPLSSCTSAAKPLPVAIGVVFQSEPVQYWRDFSSSRSLGSFVASAGALPSSSISTLPVLRSTRVTPCASLRAAFSISGVGRAPPAYHARASHLTSTSFLSSHALDANERPCVRPVETQSGKVIGSDSSIFLPFWAP